MTLDTRRHQMSLDRKLSHGSRPTQWRTFIHYVWVNISRFTLHICSEANVCILSACHTIGNKPSLQPTLVTFSLQRHTTDALIVNRQNRHYSLGIPVAFQHSVYCRRQAAAGTASSGATAAFSYSLSIIYAA
jgi:hypothetical protein